MGIFRYEHSSARWLRLLSTAPVVAALLFAASSAHAQDCEDDADCAPGYECAWVGVVDGVNTVGSVGSVSGSGGPVQICGDGTCDPEETDVSCPQDCSENRSCQVAFQMCNDDEDCAAGFYCDDENANVVTSGDSSGGGATWDGICALIGTTSGSGGGSATDGGAGSPSEDTTGSGDDGGDDSSSGSDSVVTSGDFGTIGGAFGNTASTATNGTGSGSDGDPGGSGGNGNGNGNGSGHGGNGHGNGNGNGHGPWHPHWPGHPQACSVGGVGAPAGGFFLTALAAFGAVFARRRRS